MGAPACHSHTAATPPHPDRYRLTAHQLVENHSSQTGMQRDTLYRQVESYSLQTGRKIQFADLQTGRESYTLQTGRKKQFSDLQTVIVY